LQALPKTYQKWIKRKFIMGRILAILVALACILVIFIIAANENANERLNWTVDFLKSLIQDLILTPLFFLAFQYIVVRLMKSAITKRSSKFKYAIGKVLDEHLWEISVHIFGILIIL